MGPKRVKAPQAACLRVRSWVLAAAILALASALPTPAAAQLEESGAAQLGAGCSRQCKPQDEDVNGPAMRTGDQSAQTILYGHFQDILNRAPLNTQPLGEQEEDLNRGFTMPTAVGYAPMDPTGRAYVHFENNWFFMFSSPGFVEIVDGVWRTHQEPGLAEPVQIVGDQVTLYFYLSVYPVPGVTSESSPAGNTALAVMPQVALYARMETGRHVFNPKSLLLAEADTGSGDIGPAPVSPARATLVQMPGGDEVWEFQVPMALHVNPIPSVWDGSEGYLVSVNVYQVTGDPPLEKTHVTQSDWRMRAGPSTPPRLVMEVANPLMTKSKEIVAFRENVFVRWSFASPWGSYDTDDRGLKIRVEGPGQVNPEDIKLVIIKRSVDHDGHFKPINVTWKIDHVRSVMPDGEYLVHVSIPNLQHTYQLEETFSFLMKDGAPEVKTLGAVHRHDQRGAVQTIQPGAKDSPAWPMLGALVAVAVAAAAASRRR